MAQERLPEPEESTKPIRDFEALAAAEGLKRVIYPSLDTDTARAEAGVAWRPQYRQAVHHYGGKRSQGPRY